MKMTIKPHLSPRCSFSSSLTQTCPWFSTFTPKVTIWDNWTSFWSPKSARVSSSNSPQIMVWNISNLVSWSIYTLRNANKREKHKRRCCRDTSGLQSILRKRLKPCSRMICIVKKMWAYTALWRARPKNICLEDLSQYLAKEQSL